MDEFPPNSARSKAVPTEPTEEKKIEPVVTGKATRRKKPLGKQFSNTFFGGDFKSATHYMVFNVLIPAAKDALADAGAQGLERLIFGEARGGRGSRSRGIGHIAYNRMSAQSSPLAPQSPSISNRARARHDFDEIVLESRAEAEEVLDRLYDLLSRYDVATVADLYELTGIKSTHVDHQWGWSKLTGAGVSRVRGGFLLDLPEPEPIR